MVERHKVSREIRYRSASNMQNVWDQMVFAQKMDEEAECCKEADGFIEAVSALILKHLGTGCMLAPGEVDALIKEYPMRATAERADDLQNYTEKREGLIDEAVRQFLYHCHLTEQDVFHEGRPYVNDVTDWWFSRFGSLCSNDSRFWTTTFLDWTVEGTSLYFLLNYHVEEGLLKQYVDEWVLNPAEMLQRSIEYRSEEKLAAYLEYYRESSDEEMADRAYNILQNEACMVYHDKLWHVTSMLAEAKMYGDMAELFKAIDYPILQASMLYQITEVEDLLGMMIELGIQNISHPLTAYSLIREYLYEVCARTSANLLSYEEESFGRKPAGGLEDAWKEVNELWWKALPGYFSQGVKLLKSNLDPKRLAGWAFAKQDIVPPRKNATSDGYNECTKVLKDEALKIYSPEELPLTAGDLQYLLYIGGIYLSVKNKPSADAFVALLDKIMETVSMKKILPVSAIDNKLIGDCDIVAKILCECYPDKVDIFNWFDRYKTWYEGWYVSQPSKQFDSCHREGHLLCWMLMVASLDVFDEGGKEAYWSRMMDCLYGQISAAGGYFKSEYTQVLVLAGMVAVQTYLDGLKLYVEKCCRYVMKVDDLLIAMNNAGVIQLLAGNTEKRNEMKSVVADITSRIDAEWPLRKKRLEMEGVQSRNRAKALENVAIEWRKL